MGEDTMKALCASGLLLMAMLVGGTMSEDDSIVPEWVQAAMVQEEDAFVPEPDFIEETATQEIAAKAAKEAKILKNLIELRTYCIAAREEAEDFQERHWRANSALVDFIKLFGKVKYAKPKPPATPKEARQSDDIPDLPVRLPFVTPEKKQLVGNIVVEYAKALGKAKSTYHSGIGSYLLRNLNKVVIEGKSSPLQSMVAKSDGTRVVTVSFKDLGLNGMPDFFQRLAVSEMTFRKKEREIAEQARNSDSAAAIMWLKKGEARKYKTFVTREFDKWNAKQTKYTKDMIEAIVKALGAEYAKDKTLMTLPVVGLNKFKTTKGFKRPSDEAMKEVAEAAAKAWSKKFNEGDALQAEIKSQGK